MTVAILDGEYQANSYSSFKKTCKQKSFMAEYF